VRGSGGEQARVPGAEHEHVVAGRGHRAGV
jgi:hypothetical protein